MQAMVSVRLVSGITQAVFVLLLTRTLRVQARVIGLLLAAETVGGVGPNCSWARTCSWAGYGTDSGPTRRWCWVLWPPLPPVAMLPFAVPHPDGPL